MQRSATSHVSLVAGPEEARPFWHRLALVVFTCLNVAATFIVFAVFISVVIMPPNPRSALLVLIAGRFAFAVLAMSQFTYWSWLLLRKIKGRAKA